MGSMQVTGHPPLLLAPADVPPGTAVGLRQLLHASLWLAVDLEAWQVRRSGHLRLVHEPGADELDWREVDVSRHPLRTVRRTPETDVADLEANLRRALERRCLRLYRIPALGLVSEIGEGREDFRRRSTGLLRPEVQRRVAEINAETTSRLPWRRRAVERRRADATSRLAAEVAGLAGSIEDVELPDLTLHIRRAEIGILLVAPGVRLEAPRHRSLMIESA
jgi:hypothetical protein